MSAQGRLKGEYRSAQREGTQMTGAGTSSGAAQRR